MLRHPPQSFRSRGFTLIELLVVVGIIVILVAILIPALSAAKKNARNADAKSQLADLSSGIEQYYQVFQDYPGPATVAQTTSTTTSGVPTGTQNLLLGMSYAISGTPTGKPSDCTITLTSGPVHVDAGNASGPIDGASGGKQLTAFYTPTAKDIPAGTAVGTTYTWPAGGITASPASNNAPFPTIIDHYNDPLPILYYRAVSGVEGTGTASGTTVTSAGNGTSVSPAIAYAGTAVPGTTFASYYLNENSAYTTANTTLTSPSGAQIKQPGLSLNIFAADVSTFAGTTASARGGYVLISAGWDRLYGTPDDIVLVGGR